MIASSFEKVSSLDICQRIAAQKRINQHPVAPIFELPAIMTVITQRQHKNSSLRPL